MTAVDHTATLSEYSDVEQVFEPHSSTMPPFREYVQELWERRRFIRALAQTELRGSRTNTVIGELWAVLDPLIQAMIYLFVVTIIRGGRAGNNPGETAALIISGVFFFNYTRVALSDGGRSIIKNKGLMLNSTFPRAILPISCIYVGLMELAPAAVVYAVIHVVLQRPFGPGLFVLPLLFLLQTAMNLGLAFLFATATVLVRDMINLLNYIMRVLLFITPVIYPVSNLTPALRTVLSINPLFPLFAGYQSIMLGEMPSVNQVLLSAAWATVLLVAGYRVFVSHERAFALRL
jgi:teichoic acid transport system permease protein